MSSHGRPNICWRACRYRCTRQDLGGLTIGQTEVNATIGGGIVTGNAQVQVRTRSYITEGSKKMVASMLSNNRRHYLADAFHETFHQLAKFRYGSLDSDLGRAAFKITGDTRDLPGDKGTELQWSSYFDEQLMKACIPDQRRYPE